MQIDPPDRRRDDQSDRRGVPRGGRRATDQAGRYPPILVADSYEPARRPCVRYLDHFHFDVAEASNGEEALAHIASMPPRVILIERTLPLMPAERLRQWLTQSWRTRQIVVITMVVDFARGGMQMRSGAALPGLLVKPFSLAEMLEEVRRVLRRQRVP